MRMWIQKGTAGQENYGISAVGEKRETESVNHKFIEQQFD